MRRPSAGPSHKWPASCSVSSRSMTSLGCSNGGGLVPNHARAFGECASGRQPALRSYLPVRLQALEELTSRHLNNRRERREVSS